MKRSAARLPFQGAQRRGRVLARSVLVALVFVATGVAHAQPRVVWKEATTPTFDLATAQDMLDDGTGGDAVASDGVFSLALALPADPGAPSAPRVIHYVVVPPGGDLSTAIGDASGGPMVLALPDGAARTVRITYATAADPAEPLTAACTDSNTILACKGYAPIPAVADDWNLRGTFGVAGDLQVYFGGAAWTPNTPETRLPSGSAHASLTLLAALPLTGGVRIASERGDATFGPDGWDFSGSPSAGAAYPVASEPWAPLRVEVRLDRAMARVVVLPGPALHPLLSERSTEAAAPFVEIHNRAAARLSLSGILLGDDPAYVSLGGTPGAATSGDFLVAFPPGASLAPGAFATVALGDAAAFQAALGTAPDFVLATLPPATAGSVDSAAALDATGESLFLLAWRSPAPLVVDLDVLVWGTPASGDEAPDKSGVTVAGATYGPDTLTVNASPAPGDPVIERTDFLEGAETTAPDANGLGPPGGPRHDETSEPLDTTWQTAAAPTPGAPPPGFSFLLTGEVRNAADGTPLEGATVTAEPGALTATTAADGTYRLPLPDGSYAVTAHHFHYTDVSTSVVMAGANEVRSFDLDRIPGVRVSGRVERSDGRALRDATVVLLDLPDRESRQTTTTDTNGTFLFQDFPQGMRARVNARKAGFNPRGVTRTADADINDIVIVLDAIPTGYEVTGHIEDADTGDPIPGAAAAIDELGAVASTDAAGDFRLTLIPPGTWTLRAAATSYAAQNVSVTVSDQPVVVPTIRLVQSSNALLVRGRVTVAGLGVPIAGAEVSLTPAGGGAVQVESTDALGDYVLGGVSTGTYTFAVRADGYQAYVEDNLEIRTPLTRDVELSVAGDAGFTLSGVVHLAGRQEGELGGSHVSLEGSLTRNDRTKSTGEYRFEGLPPGVYRVTATHDGYEGASLEVAVAGDATQDFILQPAEDGGGGLASCLGCTGAGGGSSPWLLLALVLAPLLRRRLR